MSYNKSKDGLLSDERIIKSRLKTLPICELPRKDGWSRRGHTYLCLVDSEYLVVTVPPGCSSVSWSFVENLTDKFVRAIIDKLKLIGSEHVEPFTAEYLFHSIGG